MKQVLPALCGLAVALAAGRADAALTWRDSPIVKTNAFCGASSSNGSLFRVGYVVDPVTDSPQVGQIFYVHAVAVGAHCLTNFVSLNFNLPTGARSAISAQTPVNCFVNGAASSNCRQQFVPTSLGGNFQVTLQPLNLGESYEIQVPIVFDRVVDGAALHVMAADMFETKDVSIGMTVPFQPDVPAGTRGQDLVLVGAAGPDAGTLPVAFANDDGSFAVTNYAAGDFPALARTPGVTRLAGDFNHDGLTDYALVGGAGWNTIPMATSLGNGRFAYTNGWVGDFGLWATQPGAKAVAGDFNRDGYTDIALVGGSWWSSIPVAFSLGSGQFAVTNVNVPSFGSWAAGANVKPLVGDFNRDGMSDIALVGGAGWNTLPVAFSYGNGNFQITNYGVSNVFNGIVQTGFNFAASAAEPGATAFTGDFNKDGYTDVGVTGGASYSGIRLAISRSGGQFSIYDNPDPYFSMWARTAGAKVLTGDFNRDGATDIAITGAPGWASVPVATSLGNGTFAVSNVQNPQFAVWASLPGVRAIVGDYNGDGYSDIALTGGAGWGTIVVGLGVGAGFFAPTTWAVHRFPGWATDTSATVLTGQLNY